MRPTVENFEVWNEELATKHDMGKLYNHPSFIYRYIEQKRISQLINLANIKPNNKILDVGCGGGHILQQIKTGELYGIDISEIQVERTKKLLDTAVEIKKAPGENIPYEDNFF